MSSPRQIISIDFRKLNLLVEGVQIDTEHCTGLLGIQSGKLQVFFRNSAVSNISKPDDLEVDVWEIKGRANIAIADGRIDMNGGPAGFR